MGSGALRLEAGELGDDVGIYERDAFCDARDVANGEWYDEARVGSCKFRNGFCGLIQPFRGIRQFLVVQENCFSLL